MSKATKRKHVVKEVLGEFVTPSEKQQIMRILGTNGNNLHDAVTDTGERFLLSMPTKFRKNIWIKRGDFVIVDPIEEGDKVKGEISFILYRDHIQYLRKLGVWPKGFKVDGESGDRKQEVQKDENDCKEQEEDEHSNSDSDDDGDLFVNTNRATVQYSESEEDSNDSDEEEENEEDE